MNAYFYNKGGYDIFRCALVGGSETEKPNWVTVEPGQRSCFIDDLDFIEKKENILLCLEGEEVDAVTMAKMMFSTINSFNEKEAKRRVAYLLKKGITWEKNCSLTLGAYFFKRELKSGKTSYSVEITEITEGDPIMVSDKFLSIDMICKQLANILVALKDDLQINFDIDIDFIDISEQKCPAQELRKFGKVSYI